MVNYLLQNFPDENIEFFVFDRRSEAILPDVANVHRVLSIREYLVNRELRYNVHTADKIIASGIFTSNYCLPLLGKAALHKSLLQFWGGDYEMFHNQRRLGLYNRVKKIIVQYCIKQCAGIILLTRQEEQNFQDVFPCVENKTMFYTPVPSGDNRDHIVDELLKERGSAGNSNKRIMVGNSSTITNHHIEIFDRLKVMDLTNVDIYCPLSYGDMTYRDEVIRYGRSCFGDHFYPVTQYMTYEDYVQFLNTCDVAMFDLERQQALGNIFLMLDLGKKVYTSPLISKHVDNYGYRTFPVRELPDTVEQLFAYSAEDQANNMSSRWKRKKDIHAEWKRIMSYKM